MDSLRIAYVVAAADSLPASLQLLYNDGVLQPQFVPQSLSDSNGALRAFTVYDEQGADVTEEFAIDEFEYTVDENGDVRPVANELAVLPTLQRSPLADSSANPSMLTLSDNAGKSSVLSDDVQVKPEVALLSNGIEHANHSSLQQACDREIFDADASVRCTSVSESLNGETVDSNGKHSHTVFPELSDDINYKTNSVRCSENSQTLAENSSSSAHTYKPEHCTEVSSPENHCNGIPDTVSEVRSSLYDENRKAHLSCSMDSSNFATSVLAESGTYMTCSDCLVSPVTRDSGCRTDSSTCKHCIEKCTCVSGGECHLHPCRCDSANNCRADSVRSDLNCTSTVYILSSDTVCCAKSAENLVLSSATNTSNADRLTSVQCIRSNQLHADGVTNGKVNCTGCHSNDALELISTCATNCSHNGSTVDTCSCKSERVWSDRSEAVSVKDGSTCSPHVSDASNKDDFCQVSQDDGTSDVQLVHRDLTECSLLVPETVTSPANVAHMTTDNSSFSTTDKENNIIANGLQDKDGSTLPGECHSAAIETLSGPGNLSEVSPRVVECLISPGNKDGNVVNTQQGHDSSPPFRDVCENANDSSSGSDISGTSDMASSLYYSLMAADETDEALTHLVHQEYSENTAALPGPHRPLQPGCSASYTFNGWRRSDDSCSDVNRMKQTLRALHRTRHWLKKLQRNTSHIRVGNADKLPSSDSNLSSLHKFDCKRLRLEALEQELTKREAALRNSDKQLNDRLQDVEQREQMLRLRERMLQKTGLLLPQNDSSMSPTSGQLQTLVSQTVKKQSDAVSDELTNGPTQQAPPQSGAGRRSSLKRKCTTDKLTKYCPPATKRKQISFNIEDVAT